ncbi:MAG: IS66 family insertion sequence element accessory protein TnpB [Ginsengibacter sp.]
MRSNPGVRRQMFEMIGQWQQSGLNKKAYCDQQSIKHCTFYYWYKHYRQQHGDIDEKSSSFVKLQIEKSPTTPSMEICFPTAIRLLFKSADQLRMLHLSASCNYYLHRNATDIRKGFDSLCGIVTSELKMNVLSGAVFIFMNKKHSQVKLLLWEGDGSAIYYKRLEKGTFELPLPTNDDKDLYITNEALQHILQGVSLKSVRK